jgi:hypothetical protein
MSWYEIELETKEGQTSFIKPSNFPDIPSANNCSIYYDGRKVLPGLYTIECDGALVVVTAPWPEGLEIVIRYSA